MKTSIKKFELQSKKILENIKDKKFMSLLSIVDLFWGYKNAPYINFQLAVSRISKIISKLMVDGYLLEIGSSPKEYYLNPNFCYDIR